MSHPRPMVYIPIKLVKSPGLTQFIVSRMRDRHPIAVFAPGKVLEAGHATANALRAERGPQEAMNLMENITVTDELPPDAILVEKAWELPK